jgi:molybdenum cofactor synthesis domain-containing protein
MGDKKYTAAVITVSDKGSRGERADTSGPRLAAMLAEDGWDVIHTAVVPDDPARIGAELIACADGLRAELVVTTGGTGFTNRDNTPEATLAVIERQAPGISEYMRAESAKVTPHGMLSRGVSGLRGGSLIINVPGSEKAASECLGFVMKTVKHAIKMLRSVDTEH